MQTFFLINLLAFIVVVLYGLFLFLKAASTRVAYMKIGKKSEFDGKVKERLKDVWTIVFGQTKLLKDKKSGIIHVLMFYGFILVQFGAIDMFIKGLAPGNHLPFGPVYPAFTFFQEFVTLAILFAVVWAFYRRYIEKLVRLKRGWYAGLVLIFIGTLMLSVLFGNAMLQIWEGQASTWAEPVASAIAFVFGFLSPTAAMVLFFISWWIHTITILAFLVYIPQSKHAHLIAAPVNVFLSKRVPGKLNTLSFDFDDESADEDDFSFGVGKVEDFEQFQMLDFYSCVECGRCTSACPAATTGKILSPMDIMIKLRDHLNDKGAAITGKSPWVPAFAFADEGPNQYANMERDAAVEQMSAVSMIGDVITEDEIFACTTCRNCEDACPVMNEHVGTIMDMRRYLVMTEGKIDPEAQRAVMNIERQGNPWGLSKKDRIKWRELDGDVYIPTLKELKKAGEEFDYLFWVSSMGAYDNRSQKIALDFAKLMNQAGVKFAILGNKEANSGDTARRIGNEFLFQEIAEKNIKEFTKHGVTKIVTIDPHAYNIFKNEYPDLGYEAEEVLHHTQMLYDLVKDGKLMPEGRVDHRLTYHDSCYLGRYNDVYDPPREILQAIPGIELVEMVRTRENGMCCGAGGGLMWTEETTGNRVNVARTEQALQVNPTAISSACPFCLTMLSDGTKAKEVDQDIDTMDVAEILALSVFKEEKIKDIA